LLSAFFRKSDSAVCNTSSFTKSAASGDGVEHPRLARQQSDGIAGAAGIPR
jgi:hypothetical protein